jgi:hypothetical protein
MKLPHSIRSATEAAFRPSRRRAPPRRVLPLDPTVGHCERACMQIEDPVVRERCLRSCGY